MSEFFFLYGLFIAKIVTGLIAVLVLVAMLSGSRKKLIEENLEVTSLNEKFASMKNKMMQTVLDKKQLKKSVQEAKKRKKNEEKENVRKRVFVLDFEGDLKASSVDSLRDEITAILTFADKKDKVLVKLDNAGGIVHEHGLAASQLQRIKDAKLSLTVSVDKVAASGGYMMACVADEIIAAPFAVLGSIGVLAQLPNFHRLLDKHGVDFEQHTAGEFKRTVTMFGENSDEERGKLKEQLEETHTLFRDFVVEHRPQLDIDKVATGEHWYATQAQELKLVDSIQTSDDWLLKASDKFDLFEVKMQTEKSMQEKLFGGLFASIVNKFADHQNKQRFY